MITGTQKTDAVGDIDNDGFNETFGWYEIDCAGGAAEYTFTTAIKRFQPIFRLNNCTGTTVTINGGAASASDYVMDNLGGGVFLLQILNNPVSDTTYKVNSPVTSRPKPFGFGAGFGF